MGVGGRQVNPYDFYHRPGPVTLLAILNFIGAPVSIFMGVGMLVMSRNDPQLSALFAGLGLLYLGLGVLSLFIGIGLWRLKGYGRMLQIVSSCFGLLAVPVGTVISGAILYYFTRPGVRVLFSETPVSQLTDWDIAEVEKLHSSAAGLVMTLAITVPLVVAMVGGVIIAVSLPNARRAAGQGGTGEDSALHDLQRLASAQVAYSKANGGHYDRPECLLEPADCIPGYPGDGRGFLMSAIPDTRGGYRREFLPGEPASDNDITFGHLSPSSMKSFVFVVYPDGEREGPARSFCTDATGRVCVTSDGSRPAVVGGKCAPACRLLGR